MDRKTLRQDISLGGFFCLAFGSMIGIGWVTGLGGWLIAAGPGGAMLAFLCGGALMAAVGLCYAELTSMIPVAGGEVAYAFKAFGAGKAYLVGWFLAFGYLSVSAFEAASVGRVLGYLFPAIDRFPLYEVAGNTVYGSHVVLAAGCTAVITVVNYLGPRQAVGLQVILTTAFIVIGAGIVAIGLFLGELENLRPAFGAEAAAGAKVTGFLAVFVTVPFWFVGFDTIPQSAEEARAGVSARQMGLLVVVSILGAAAFYVLLILSAGMAAPWREIARDPLPTASAFARVAPARWLVDAILVAALLGLLTSWNGFFLAGSRVLFALGRGALVPTAFGAVDEGRGTPRNAVLFSGLVTALSVFLGRGAMIAFVDVGSFCIAAAFLGVSLSFLRLRRDFPRMHRPYRVRHGSLAATTAFLGSLLLLAVMLLPVSTASLVWPLEWLLLVGICILGFLFWRLGRRERDRVTHEARCHLILEDY